MGKYIRGHDGGRHCIWDKKGEVFLGYKEGKGI